MNITRDGCMAVHLSKCVMTMTTVETLFNIRDNNIVGIFIKCMLNYIYNLCILSGEEVIGSVSHLYVVYIEYI